MTASARPWAEWKRGKPLSAASLSRLLKPFEIKSGQLKRDGKNKNGYELKHFKDSFERYTFLPTPGQSSTSLPSSDHEGFEGNRNSTSDKKVEDEKRSKPAPIAKGREVELQSGGTGEEDIKESNQVPEPLSENDQGREVFEP